MVGNKENNKLALIEIYDERIFYENSGIHRIAAFLENHGMHVQVKYLKNGSDIGEELLTFFGQFQFIGFAVYDINLDYAKEMTKKIKEYNKDIIVFYGSQYVTLTYQEMLEYDRCVDFLVLGDGEFPILDFIENYNGTNKEELIKNNNHLISYEIRNDKYPCFTDIDKLPWPKHDDKIIKENLYTYIQSSNGCLGDCTFCARARRGWSWRTPEDMVAEITSIREQHNIRAFIFADSNFGDIGEKGKQRIHRFLDLLEKDENRYAFCAYFRAEAYKNIPSDIELLKRMRRAGFVQAFVGIESGSPKDLQLYRKIATLEDNKEILELLRSCDIEPLWGFMMFNPYSDEETLYENYKFLTDYDSFIPVHFINHVNIYKNTQLYNKAKEDGLIIEHKMNKIEYRFVNKYVHDVFEFFQKRYFSTSLFKSARNIRDATRLYLYLSVLVDDIEKETDIVKNAKKQLALLNKEYFKICYLERNLKKADDEYNTYISRVKFYSDMLERVKISMIRKYGYKYGF